MKRAVLWLFAITAPLAAAVFVEPPARDVSFSKKVLPVLKAHCSTCHSGANPASGLDLTSSKGIVRVGKSGLLLKRLRGEGGLQQMPMGFVPLPKETIAEIEAWVKGGCAIDAEKEPTHWAFLAPKRPQLPGVRNADWVRNPIDAFVLSKLEKNGLSPSKQAAKTTLLRRVYLDLIGLPPTPSEIDAFLKDGRPDAYEKVVDRLLASPHYGERQARPWLDLARYADSNGYEKDGARVMWLYRDWVIDAFNRNTPYDEFTIEQIAGDLLPNASLQQLVATGFHRNTMFNQEGGVDQDEARFEVMVDRVSTTGTVWLGLTVGCARCHDHKYDPIKQKDFYSLLAFFASTDYEARGDASVSAQNYFEPEIAVPSKEQSLAITRLKSQIAELDKQIKNIDAAELSEWKKAINDGVNWSSGVSQGWSGKSGTSIARAGDAYVATGGGANDTYTVDLELMPGTYRAIRLDVLPDDSLPMKGPGRADSGNFILSTVTGSVKISSGAADFVQDGYDVAACFDDNSETGWAIYDQIGKPHTAVFVFDQPVDSAFPFDIFVNFEFGSKRWPNHTLGKFKVSISGDKMAIAAAAPMAIKVIAEKDSISPADEKQLKDYVVTVSPLGRRRAELVANLRNIESQIPRAQVMTEKSPNSAHTAPIRNRGEFTNPGEPVGSSTPTFLAPTANGNRLALAKWLVSKRNPLTARVEVNRIWEQYFGRGIVETSENFGTQCSPPTHPELLDWLATEFMRRHWDMKAMHRMIVTSATYMQSSNATKLLLQKDPNNELLARGPRFRMEAEMIRDNALAASGLLTTKIGGPSVYPVQPDGVWDNPFNSEQWMTSQGADRYRRGIYTFTKRTAPYPAFTTFDSTSRESCTVRRVRTNTPLQALNLLNDEQYLESARALAKRVSWMKTPTQSAALAFRHCTARYPSLAERSRLTKLYEELVSKRGMSRSEAMAMVCSVILNLDETITKN